MTWTKRTDPAHPQAVLVEAAGLRWLAQAHDHGGPAAAQVISAEPGTLVLERIRTAAADPQAVEDFGEALARMHRSLPDQTPFGALPPDHPPGQPPLFGPADALLEMGSGTSSSWGSFYARQRLQPVLDQLRVHAPEDDMAVLAAAQEKIAAGAFDDDEPPSLIHGDLWSGNVLFSRDGAVLIDPAAHAGHRESDLAMLQLFGFPHHDRLLAGYQRTAPLRPGWQDRICVHQLFYLAVHWLLFGQGYRSAALTAAEQTLQL